MLNKICREIFTMLEKIEKRGQRETYNWGDRG